MVEICGGFKSEAIFLKCTFYALHILFQLACGLTITLSVVHSKDAIHCLIHSTAFLQFRLNSTCFGLVFEVRFSYFSHKRI